MAALPDAESSGIVSLVLETTQPGGVVTEVGWGVSSSGATRRGWASPEQAAGVGDGGCTMFSESPASPSLDFGCSFQHITVPTTGISLSAGPSFVISG